MKRKVVGKKSYVRYFLFFILFISFIILSTSYEVPIRSPYDSGFMHDGSVNVKSLTKLISGVGKKSYRI